MTPPMMGFPCTLLFSGALLLLKAAVCSAAPPNVPCLFIFGDSLVDNGNNNRILTLAKANFAPYGIDFSEGVTGRFTNGRTTVDVLAELLGLDGFIPPYAGTRGRAILRGLNYASGAAGIREESGNNLGAHISMEEQVGRFRRTVREMGFFMRGNQIAVREYLSRCIFYSAMGSNDYLNNYFMPDYYSTSKDYDPKTFSELLLQDYTRHLEALYELGARKMVVVGVGQVGCIPYQLARYDRPANGSRCNEKINKAIAIYNAGLQGMVNRLNSEVRDAMFTFVNSYSAFKDLISNAAAYGLEMIDKGCCGVGKNNGQITCLPVLTPCEDRSKYLFWDAFHPTDAANVILALKAFNSTSRSDVYPYNILQLAAA